jgi:hypothetical protein
MEIVGKCLWTHKGKPIGKFISCVEDSKGLTVTVEYDADFIKRINKVINSKATDKKKVEKIQKILN